MKELWRLGNGRYPNVRESVAKTDMLRCKSTKNQMTFQRMSKVRAFLFMPAVWGPRGRYHVQEYVGVRNAFCMYSIYKWRETLTISDVKNCSGDSGVFSEHAQKRGWTYSQRKSLVDSGPYFRLTCSARFRPGKAVSLERQKKKKKKKKRKVGRVRTRSTRPCAPALLHLYIDELILAQIEDSCSGKH